MPQPLTERELILLTKLGELMRDYTDSNPDVGMGPNDAMLIDRVVFSLPFDVSTEDRRAAAARMAPRR